MSFDINSDMEIRAVNMAAPDVGSNKPNNKTPLMVKVAAVASVALAAAAGAAFAAEMALPIVAGLAVASATIMTISLLSYLILKFKNSEEKADSDAGLDQIENDVRALAGDDSVEAVPAQIGNNETDALKQELNESKARIAALQSELAKLKNSQNEETDPADDSRKSSSQSITDDPSEDAPIVGAPVPPPGAAASANNAAPVGAPAVAPPPPPPPGNAKSMKNKPLVIKKKSQKERLQEKLAAKEKEKNKLENSPEFKADKAKLDRIEKELGTFTNEEVGAFAHFNVTARKIDEKNEQLKLNKQLLQVEVDLKKGEATLNGVTYSDRQEVEAMVKKMIGIMPHIQSNISKLEEEIEELNRQLSDIRYENRAIENRNKEFNDLSAEKAAVEPKVKQVEKQIDEVNKEIDRLNNAIKGASTSVSSKPAAKPSKKPQGSLTDALNSSFAKNQGARELGEMIGAAGIDLTASVRTSKSTGSDGLHSALKAGLRKFRPVF